MFQIGQLLQHADFLQDHAGKGLQHRFDGVAGLVGKQRTEESHEQVQQQDVDANFQLNVFPQQLNGHGLAGGFQSRLVNLADRGAGQRLLIKPVENVRIGKGTPEDSQAVFLAHRRHPVVQLPQLQQVVRVKKIGPGSQNLCKLKKTGAERADVVDQGLR